MKTRRVVFLIPTLVTLFLAACDSGGGGGGGTLGGLPGAGGTPGAAGGTPVQKCEAFLTAACNKLIACGQAPDVATCVAGLRQSIPCEKAVAVGQTYDACMAAVPGISCPVGDNSLPAACSMVVSIGQ